MNLNRLSAELTAMLNMQVTEEAYAAQLYLSYGAWASGEGYGGIARFRFRHAEKERNHMTEILEYILKKGGQVQIAAITRAA